MTFVIIYSRDKTLYYISDRKSDSRRPHHWMSVAKIPGPATQHMIEKVAGREGIFGKPFVEFRLNSGDVYCREVLPFAFWSVKSGDIESISVDDDLWKDYACFSQWKI